MYDKIKKALAWIGAGILIIGGTIWAILGGRSRGDRGADRIQRELGKSIDRADGGIERQGRAIDKAIEIIGDDKIRKRESAERDKTTAELIEDSRRARETAREFLEKNGD